jgi:hypothetical protein
MPMGGDWAFAGVYMLGGEYAARLLNLFFFLMIAGLVFEASRRWLTMAEALLLTALFATTPLIQVVTGSLLVENVWAVFVTAAVLSPKYHDTGAGHFVLVGVFLGCRCRSSTALGRSTRHSALGGAGVETQPPSRPDVSGRACHAAGAVNRLRSSSLPDCSAKTGNPVFLLNHIFSRSLRRLQRLPRYALARRAEWNTLYNSHFACKYLRARRQL